MVKWWELSDCWSLLVIQHFSDYHDNHGNQKSVGSQVMISNHLILITLPYVLL